MQHLGCTLQSVVLKIRRNWMSCILFVDPSLECSSSCSLSGCLLPIFPCKCHKWLFLCVLCWVLNRPPYLVGLPLQVPGHCSGLLFSIPEILLFAWVTSVCLSVRAGTSPRAFLIIAPVHTPVPGTYRSFMNVH